MKGLIHLTTKFLTLICALALMFTTVLYSPGYSKAAAKSCDKVAYGAKEDESTDDEEDADDDTEEVGIDLVMNFYASKITKKYVNLKWDKVEDADGYVVEYKAAFASKWISETVTGKTSLTVKGLNVGTKYNFRIKAYIFYEDDDTVYDDEEDAEDAEDAEDIEDDEDYSDDVFDEYEYGEYSKMNLKTLALNGSGDKIAVSSTYEAKAKGVKATKVKDCKSDAKGQATVSWEKDTKVTGYEIYMSSTKDSTYKKIATIKNPTIKKKATIKENSTVKYTQKKLKSKKKYYFKIRGYVKKGKTKSYTEYSPIKGVKVK